LEQGYVGTFGHAIEFRVYAESPSRGFAPTTGKALRLHWPEGEGIRVDSGIIEGQAVTSAFDPMLAKLIVHAPSRAEALARAKAALKGTVLLGCETNLAFLARLVEDRAFVAGDVHTGYLDATPELAQEPALDPARLKQVLAAVALTAKPVRDAAEGVPLLHASIGAWRN
jgi:acetyl/propionyl-CoA carboxylase alpha subunit